METITNPITSLFDKGKLFIKAVVIFFMALGLWIPTFMIMELVRERESRQMEAFNDISTKWAGRQVITGPVIHVPYMKAEYDNANKVVMVKKSMYFMPDKADMRVSMEPQTRHRGIYDVIVYASKVNITGKFKPIQVNIQGVTPSDILWNEASIVMDVTDHLRGVNEDIVITVNDSAITFNPQPSGVMEMKAAFMAPLKVEPNMEYTFNTSFTLNGSGELLVAATARENKIEMRSSWKDPSFTGVKLPDERVVNDSGFVATWKFMNRAMPQVWDNTVYNVEQATFGTDLIVPVDSYDKTRRSVKYALLCIVLTFAAFFLIETIYKRPLHLIQYGLAGLALVLFYTLLLSISEYTGFNLAYLIAGIATIGLVVWYVGSIMRSGKLALFISFVLTVVYGYIFSIIQLQDYSLLMGSIGLFIALGVIMYFSRKLQW